MAISHIHRLDQLIQQDVQSDRQNVQVVRRLLDSLQQELQLHVRLFEQLVQNNTVLPELIEKLFWLQQQDIELDDYEDQQALDQFRKYELEDDKIDEWETESLLVITGICGSFTYLENELIQKIRKEGYIEVSKVVREIKTGVTRNKGLKRILNLRDTILEMNDLLEDLAREQRKCESKLQRSRREQLLQELKEEQHQYQKDTILLIQGLLQTEGDYFYQLKSQLDEQYNHFIQEKVVAISKLINIQEKVFIDETKIKGLIDRIRQKSMRLIKKLD